VLLDLRTDRRTQGAANGRTRADIASGHPGNHRTSASPCQTALAGIVAGATGQTERGEGQRSGNKEPAGHFIISICLPYHRVVRWSPRTGSLFLQTKYVP
jgi:hypothetical protein